MLSISSLLSKAPIVPILISTIHSRAQTFTTTTKIMSGPSTSIADFSALLSSSTRVLALCGAGLSAASGLDTFRGAGGMWRKHRATDLATPQAFAKDPGLVWLFYSYRRHRALAVKPNRGHLALAELARKMPGFVCLTQNVDGLSQRASHPPDQLKLLHGSLFDIKCFNSRCLYIERNNYDDPFHPSLAITSSEDSRLASSSTSRRVTETPVPKTKDLPRCPSCSGLLRPGVVWFGEQLPTATLEEIDQYIYKGKIDLILVIGTTATVYPAAGYISQARAYGARVVVINTEGADLGAADNLSSKDFLFVGDAAEILPEILKSVIGEL